ncbi:non-ribosomal peptide synthetase [Streptomyces sp. NPDC005727]|uniref:non-ribosomal peptide synthetase n=1 Tax=Streptomyces sp. NPDC005727 TaxID=3157053 RepID=UPI0033D3008F
MDAATSLVSVFTERARAHPDRLALKDLDYAGLDARTNRVAHQLRAAGVRTGDVVGVRAPRCEETVVLLLGILKAGAAYLALDPGQPLVRQRQMLADASVTVLFDLSGEARGPAPHDLTGRARGAGTPAPQPRKRHDFPGRTVLTRVDTEAPDTPLDAGVGPADLAYVAYTSGSTGRPKGVAVPHRAVLRLVVDGDVVDAGPQDVFLHFAPVAFDASTLEIWGALLNGARLAVVPPGAPSLAELLDFLRDERVSVAWLTAGLFHRAVDTGITGLPHLRRLIAGGDVLSPGHVARAVRDLPHTTVVNGYGPTENTTFTCCHPVTAPVEDSVPIGRPVRGTGVHLLDARLSPVADGEVGEIYATGLGLAHGYVNDPATTASRFVADPYGPPGSRMYRTGDLARRVGGTLRFLGRADDQVKIRGFRVETDEVVAALLTHPDVRQAAVTASWRDAQPRERVLVAHVVTTPGASVLDVRAHLARLLPPYAVPSLIRTLDALPLRDNGKVDRTALEELGPLERPAVNAAHRKPATDLEEVVVQLWTDRLGTAGIGADDDFFELGGHSLLALTITGELLGRYGVEVSPLDFYLDPTPAGLARTLRRATRGNTRGEWREDADETTPEAARTAARRPTPEVSS